MTGRVYTAAGESRVLPPLLSWTLTFTGGVPCDSFSAVFPYDAALAGALRTAARFSAEEEGKTLLRGLVDEYSVSLGPGGLTASIAGRGLAALLLDNESQSLTYQEATLAEIVRRHAAPYGIAAKEIAEIRSSAGYTVPAGSSQWKALEGFCRAYGGFTPRFTPTGELLAAPERDGGRRLVIGEGDPVLSCTLREDHYGVLTEALVIDKKRNVSYSVKNQERAALGGQCRRVIYTPGQSTWDAMRYTGEYQIRRSREEEKALTVRLPGSFLAYPGDIAQVDLPRLGLRRELRVAEAENTFSPGGGAVITLTLKERG